MEETYNQPNTTEESANTQNPQPERFEPLPHNKNTGMAVVAYILFFIPLLTDAKDDPFVKYHVHQGLVLFLAWILTSVVAMMPFIMFVAYLIHIGLIVLFVIGILHAVHGEEKPLPLIGQFAENFKF